MKKALLILSLLATTAFAIEPPKASKPPAPPAAKVEEAKPAPVDEHAARVLAETRVKELEAEVAKLNEQLLAQQTATQVVEGQRNEYAAKLLNTEAAYRLRDTLAAKK